MDHEGRCKYFLNFRERTACIMNSLGNIIEKDLDKNNFWSEFFTGDEYEQYTTTSTNSQGDKYGVTEEDINAGMNVIAYFFLLHNSALK